MKAILFMIFTLLITQLYAQSNDFLKVLRITPNGNDASASSQIVIEFDRDVVALGEARVDASALDINITPKLECEWRWLSPSALACQLNEITKLQDATEYTVVVNKGIKSLDAKEMQSSYKSEFTTQGAKVNYAYFKKWLSPVTPLMALRFNIPVKKESIKKAIYFSDASGKRFDVVVFSNNLQRVKPYYEDTKQNLDANSTKDSLVWIIEPKERLPQKSEIFLNVGQGLEALSGGQSSQKVGVLKKFMTFEKLEFKGIVCKPKGKKLNENISFKTLKYADKQNKTCKPLSLVGLLFSSPVSNSSLKKSVTFSPKLNEGRENYDPWKNSYDYNIVSYPHIKDKLYVVWLPENLKANKEYKISIDARKLQDLFGTKMEQTKSIKFNFFTAHREPRLNLNYTHAVLESGVDSSLSAYVTNLDFIDFNYEILNVDTHKKDLKRSLKIKKIEDVAYKVPLGIRDMIGDKSGVFYGELVQKPVVDAKDINKLFAQVTPFSVHAKMGHFNSMIWVSRFSDALAVADAEVSLYRGTYEDLAKLELVKSNLKTDKDGFVRFDGISELDPNLQHFSYWLDSKKPRYFAMIKKDKEMALLPLDYNFQVRSNGTYAYTQSYLQHSSAWGTTAQGVYKLGDKVEFKLYVRDQNNTSFVAPKKSTYTLSVFDPQRKELYKKTAITLNDFGSFSDEFIVPKNATTGRYFFELKREYQVDLKEKFINFRPMSFLVSDFTPSPFRVKTELNGESFSSDENIKVSSLATLFSGGAFGDADIRVNAYLKQKRFFSKEPLTKGFAFSSRGKFSKNNLLDIRSRLDAKGENETIFKIPKFDLYYGSIVVESSIKDDRGKFVASSARAKYFGRDRFVGLKNTSWIYEKDKSAQIEVVVVDKKSKPISGVEVDIKIEHETYVASKVKGAGNAFLTQTIRKWIEEDRCKVISSEDISKCEFTPKNTGYYRFVATIKDSNNKEHKSTIYAWVTGSGSLLWNDSNDATLKIVPEKNSYKIGESARYLVKNPFVEAKALVTIERYGIIDSWIETFDSSTPIVNVPIKAEYLPGFYLSVVVLSPRVEKPQGLLRVDLAKPSYKMAYVKTQVKDSHKELAFDIKTDKEVYKPRDKVKVKLKVKSPKVDKNEPYEIAIAVVDESVLALNKSGDKYYDPYLGFNKLDSLDVQNYNLISRLIGRQKFEKKGANAGGDGGGVAHGELRSIFKYVTYWNPSIVAKDGETSVFEFELPDNLTGWRIIAFGVSKDDIMGHSSKNIKVNRPTEMRPIMPNQLLEGDSFKAGFSVMNRTSKKRDIKVEVKVSGALALEIKKEFTLSLEAYERKSVYMDVKTQGFGELIFKASARDSLDADSLEHKIVVNKSRSLETSAFYGSSQNSYVEKAIHIPKDIYTDVGSIKFALSPSIVGNLGGAFAYLREYPFSCWEQVLSKSLAASKSIELNEYLNDDEKYPDAKSYIEKTMQSASNFQAPNGGMSFWKSSNEYVSPYLSAYTALGFVWLKEESHKVSAEVDKNLNRYLLDILRNDKFPKYYSKGMSSSVRAVALNALAKSKTIDASDIKRYKDHVKDMSLFGKSNFLQAAISSKKISSKTKNEVLDSILSHANETGSKVGFSENIGDDYTQMLSSSLRTECSILSTLIQAQDDDHLLAIKVESIIPKLLRSILQSRKNKNDWGSTQENLFCLNAISDYAKVYELKKPSMRVIAHSDKKVVIDTTFKDKKDAQVEVSRDLRASDEDRKSTFSIDKYGEGRVYYSAKISYAPKAKNTKRINSGIEVKREYSVQRDGEFVMLKPPMKIKKSDIVRVDLFILVPVSRHFVLVHDPMAGGLEPINSDLATTSLIDANKGEFIASKGSFYFNRDDWTSYGRYFWSFYHKELKHDGVNFYADYLPSGNYHLSYTAQAIAEGDFSILATHAFEMYESDIYGKSMPSELKVIND
nr:MG2 domain-containing protein [uncultured Sulfurimonas sp.]